MGQSLPRYSTAAPRRWEWGYGLYAPSSPSSPHQEGMASTRLRVTQQNSVQRSAGVGGGAITLQPTTPGRRHAICVGLLFLSQKDKTYIDVAPAIRLGCRVVVVVGQAVQALFERHA